MNLYVRLARVDEAHILTHIAITAKAHWGYPKGWMGIWTPQLTFSPEYFRKNESWVAEVAGMPIAFHTLQDKAGSAWLENLWVLPKYIGKGVGKRLFVHAMELARQKGYTTVQLEADPNAMGFYEKMGMRRIGQRHYELEGQPRILPLMEMIL